MNKGYNRTTILRIPDMDCPDEVALIEKSLKSLPGLVEIKVNLMTRKATINHTKAVAPMDLISILRRVQLHSFIDEGREEKQEEHGHMLEKWLVAVSGVSMTLGLIFKFSGIVPPIATKVLFGFSIASGGWLIFPNALAAVRRLSPEINLLMTITIVGALIIGEWTEAAIVVFLFSFSELLETLSVARTRREIRTLLNLSPQTALVKKGNEFQEMSVEEVNVGDTVLVKSDARFPLDGEVVHGRSEVNEAPITGESIPVEKNPGDPVFAGDRTPFFVPV